MRSNLCVGVLVVMVGCVDTVTTVNTCLAGRCLDAGLTVRDAGSVDGGDRGTMVGADAGIASAHDLVSLEVTPAVVTLSPALGQRLSQAFTARVVRRDGTKGTPSNLLWTQNVLVAGDLDGNTGVFTTTGLAGATVTVTATTTDNGLPFTGTATLTVKVLSVGFGATTPSDAPAKFAAPQAPNTDSANVTYPLDNAVMPQNVYPADIQWLKGELNDVFRITMSKSGVSVTQYLLHSGTDFMNHWQVDQTSWRALAQSNPDEAATITVDRWVSATGATVSSAPIHVKFAKAALSGSVYYWAISQGRVYRIDDGTNVRVNFLPNPPVQQEGGGNTSQCVGCHSVSPSGRYMSTRMGGGFNFGTVFDLTSNLTTSPPPSLFSTDLIRWWFSTWRPDEARLMVSTGLNPSTLALVDPHTGAQIAAGGAGLPTDNAAHPQWAPDGTAVAYVQNANTSDWGIDYTDSSLALIPVTGTDVFGVPNTILKGVDVPGHDPNQRALAYPVWTPDSKRLAFAEGLSARSAAGPSRLFMVNKDGTGAVALGHANGGQANSYEPRFSPFDSGGYYWLAFLSRRDYGNAAEGTAGTAVAQIWVTAIKKNPLPGEDPSEVGYWLPGQNPKSPNISAYWAPRACRATGAGCGVDSECCSGDCRPPISGGSTICSPPPAERCRTDGQTCGGSGECCTGLSCDQNVCKVPIQ